MTLFLILASPLVLALAVIAVAVCRRLRLLSVRVPFLLGFGLFSAVGFGGVALLSFIEIALLYPAWVQKDLLGRRVVSVASLRHFDWQDGIVDPMVRWTYDLDDETLARLMARCETRSEGVCFLGSRTDGRDYFSEAAIVEGQLILEDGLM